MDCINHNGIMIMAKVANSKEVRRQSADPAYAGFLTSIPQKLNITLVLRKPQQPCVLCTTYFGAPLLRNKI